MAVKQLNIVFEPGHARVQDVTDTWGTTRKQTAYRVRSWRATRRATLLRRGISWQTSGDKDFNPILFRQETP